MFEVRSLDFLLPRVRFSQRSLRSMQGAYMPIRIDLESIVLDEPFRSLVLQDSTIVLPHLSARRPSEFLAENVILVFKKQREPLT